MSQHPFALYNPALLPPEDLLREYTARQDLLKTLLRIVADNAPGRPPQHVVLIGARGMGKTTTLWAVAHSIDRDPALRAQWQPVVFDEESRRIGDLAEFWLEAIRHWEHVMNTGRDTAAELLKKPPPDLEDIARNTFLRFLDAAGRRAILLVDNLNDVFANFRDHMEAHRLRAFLMEDSRVMILGAASRYFDDITGLSKPFFDFFRVFELKSLTLEEMTPALLRIADLRGDDKVRETIKTRAGTVKALHILTGGNPRLMRTFYRLLAEGLNTDLREDLQRLVDEFTPYFKAILDALPAQQQRIVDAVALAWEPVEVATIAAATRLPGNQVSAQLKVLVRQNLITSAGTAKRKTYLIADRFSNIHYLMRHGRAFRRRLDWFVLTLRALFSDDDSALASVARKTASSGEEGLRDARDLLSSGLHHAATAREKQALLTATFQEMWGEETLSRLHEWLDGELVRHHLPEAAGELDIVSFMGTLPVELRKKLEYRPEDAVWWNNIAVELWNRKAYALMEAACRKAIALDPKDATPWYSLGYLFHVDLDRHSEAEEAYRKSIALDPKEAYPWNGLGNLLQEDHLGRHVEAEEAYRKAIALDPKFAHPWNGLGTLLQDHLGRPAEAEEAFRKSIALDPKFAYPWHGLGNLLKNHLGQPAEAEEAYRKAIDLDPKLAAPWNGLGNLLKNHLGRHAEAEEAYRKSIALDPKYAYPWNGLGNLLQNHFGRHAEAEKAYRKSIALDPTDAYPWHGLGNALSSQPGRHAEAEEAYCKAIALDPKYARPHSGLAEVLTKREGPAGEAREHAAEGLALKPDYGHARRMFRDLCLDDLESWRRVLPDIAAWSAAHPEDSEFFEFTIDGFLRLARLGSPAEAAAIIAALPDAQPYETLRDAFRAHAEPAHLQTLAPERRTAVEEILRRLAEPPGGTK